ncbi:MAG TPA: SRPBCC family protein [Acidimicrobiia bacterium]|nr:SRPBCC family protein [Acidimicrobiia bacterium]
MTDTYPIRPVKVSQFVAAPSETVFAFVADTRNDPAWCPNVTEVVQISGDGVAPGSRFGFHQTVATGGRTFESDVEVEVVEMTRDSITWRIEDKFQERTVSLIVEPSGQGSMVTQITEAGFKRKPDLLTKTMYPILARRTFRDQFERLAEHLAV